MASFPAFTAEGKGTRNPKSEGPKSEGNPKPEIRSDIRFV